MILPPVLIHAGEHYISLSGMRRRLLSDEDMLQRVAAVLKVSNDRGDTALEQIRMLIGAFLYEVTR